MADNLFKTSRGQAADVQHHRFATGRGGIRAAGHRSSRLSSAFRLLALLPFVTIASGPVYAENGSLVLSQSPERREGEANVMVDHAGDARHRIRVVLQTDGAPGPGDVANLTFWATPLLDAPDLRIEWLLPDGGEWLGGPAGESLGHVAAGQMVPSARQVRFPKAGVYRVMAVAGYRPVAEMQFSAVGVLFFTVRAYGKSVVSDQDPTAVSPHRTVIATHVVRQTVPMGLSPEGDPCFTVNGNVSRVERPPLRNGYGPNATVPVRFAKVEMREEDIIFDDSYGERTTDANGNFSFSFCDDDGLFDDELELYVRLRAELIADGHGVVEVEDSSWIDEVYGYDSAVVESEGGALSINFNLDLSQSAVFNIADAVYEAWKVWNDAGGAVGDDAIFDPGISVNLETYDSTRLANLLNERNEMAIAAMLWDRSTAATSRAWSAEHLCRLPTGSAWAIA